MGAPSSKPSQNIELHIQRTQYRLSSHKNIQMWGGNDCFKVVWMCQTTSNFW